MSQWNQSGQNDSGKARRVIVTEGAPGIKSEFIGVTGERMTQISNLPVSGSGVVEVRMKREVGRDASIGDFDKGKPLSAYNPFHTGPSLSSLRTINTSPFVDDILPEAQLHANEKHPVTILNKPVTSSVESLGKNELGLHYIADTTNSMPYGSKIGAYAPPPSTVVNPATFNYVTYRIQLGELEKGDDDGEENPYYSMNAMDYFKDWRVAGVVEFEEGADGAETFQTSGFNDRDVGTVYRAYQAAGGYKIQTVTSKGPEFMYNYFGSQIYPGGKCYAIIKKHNVPAEYRLSNKFNVSQYSGKFITRQVKKDRPFLPYQMSFICLPKGGTLPRAAVSYLDEWGHLRRDGLAIYLGSIFSVPIGHVYSSRKSYMDNLPIMNPEMRKTDTMSQAFGYPYSSQTALENSAFSDSNKNISYSQTMLLKIILNPGDMISPL